MATVIRVQPSASPPVFVLWDKEWTDFRVFYAHKRDNATKFAIPLFSCKKTLLRSPIVCYNQIGLIFDFANRFECEQPMNHHNPDPSRGLKCKFLNFLSKRKKGEGPLWTFSMEAFFKVCFGNTSLRGSFPSGFTVNCTDNDASRFFLEICDFK